MKTIPCDHCEGTGWAVILPGETPRYCGSCEGKGTVQEDERPDTSYAAAKVMGIPWDEPYSDAAARLAPNPQSATLRAPRPGQTEANIRRESDAK